MQDNLGFYLPPIRSNLAHNMTGNTKTEKVILYIFSAQLLTNKLSVFAAMSVLNELLH